MKKLIFVLCLVLVACASNIHDVDYHLSNNAIKSLNFGVSALVIPTDEELDSLGLDDPSEADNMDTLGRKHSPYCSAFFISPTTIMTAAHCVSRREIVETIFGRLRVPTDDSPVGDLKKVVSYSQALTSHNQMTQYRLYVVVKYDRVQDLAILNLQQGQTPHRFVNVLRISRDWPDFGDRVYAIGHPAGQSWTVTDGIVSNPRRLLKSRHGDQRVIQSSAPIFFGNSGGPLLNNEGEVIGVCSRMIQPHLAFFTHLKSIRSFIRGVKL